jgi:SPP1 gp7 family putative phage head morphogenesis protein
VASGRSGERYTPQAYRSSLTGIRAAISTIQSLQPTLFQVLTRWAGAGGIAAQMARSHTAREFLMFDGRPVLMPTVPVRLASDLATGQSSPLEKYFATTARNYSAEVLRDVHRELAVGVVRGENTDDLIHRLMATGRVAERDGLLGGAWLARAEYRAERVVRTELAAAYNRELDETFGELKADFPDLLRRWDAHADARLCERCQELHGRTIDPSKGERFPNGEEGPPLHPNCRCRADLWRPEWARYGI